MDSEQGYYGIMQENSLSKLPEKVHFIGVGGIGMSALAQMLKWQGVDVSGSDRALDNPENAAIFSALREQEIRLYHQDGSYVSAGMPEAIVYSTAIENDNPDFMVAQNTKRIHRADMLALAISYIVMGNTIAVSGSCGKTTVTAWLTETLFLLGQDPLMIGGGLSNRFINKHSAGNFRIGNGAFTVFEADESDKSLLQFNPDFAIILNIGTDHYPREELRDLFREFLTKIVKGVIVSDEVYRFLGKDSFSSLKVAIFADACDEDVVIDPDIKIWTVDQYSSEQGISEITLNRDLSFSLPVPGRHSALNAAAILAMCEMVGVDTVDVLKHIVDFQGVWRRFDYTGITPSGTKVYDDYAHNVEKIISCIKTAKEVASGRVLAVFQPHGFAPLKFMRTPLFDALEATLGEDDIFAFLPVFYAGGSTSFSPTSEEVVAGYQENGSKVYSYFSTREEIVSYYNLQSSESDVIVVMGARDNSLSDFAEDFI
jgi:UDP-N-acetylmuramate--alanine ligase